MGWARGSAAATALLLVATTGCVSRDATPSLSTQAVAASSTTTTTKPKSTTTTTKPKSPAEGVLVKPGSSIQGAVDSHPAGTTFVLGSGVHRRQTVVPKAKNVFVGEPGAVMDGEGVADYAFLGKGADDVVIRGLVIERYATPLRDGTIMSKGGSQDWVVEDNEIRYNDAIGIKATSGWRILDNYIHHNQQLGLGGSGSNILVQGNEIAYTNWEGLVHRRIGGGGSKWVHTTNLVVRNNYSHDNRGAGLHTDGNNLNTLYEGNRVVNNGFAGIKHEVSCDAVIRNNVAEGNGFGNDAWIAGAGILVMNSPNVEVYGNTVRNNNDGIGGIHADRDDKVERCPLDLRNFNVHHNTIVMQVGHTGIVSNTGSSAVYNSWNNRFDYNTYTLGSKNQYYKWDGTLTTKEWKQTGQDPNSTWK